jgi:hypothetical protein
MPDRPALPTIQPHRVNGSRLELDAELYEDHVRGAEAVATLDVGGRYHLHRGFNLLFMAGRSLSSNSPGRSSSWDTWESRSC